jgi:hypothetical protein
MALVDSAAEFTVRAQQLNLTEHLERMAAAGVTTFANLAFFSAFLPGGTEEVFNTSLALPLYLASRWDPSCCLASSWCCGKS